MYPMPSTAPTGYGSLPDGMSPSLPSAPPTKKPSIWDKEHISETLAGIGAGFFSGQNFGDGLGAAAQTIAGRQRQLREEQRPEISYGGPGDQFEITADRRTGAKSYREVPEFRAATDRALAAKRQPDPKDVQDRRSRALYAIATQVQPEQRAEAYRRLLANPEQFGVDTTGMPAEWDETYGTLGGAMGLNVAQGRTQDRLDDLGGSLKDHRKVQEEQGAARVAQGAARVAQGAARLRTPPASVRKPRFGTLSVGTPMGGFVYQGGDPHDRNNWKKQ
jgi:hypothetical protein